MGRHKKAKKRMINLIFHLGIHLEYLIGWLKLLEHDDAAKWTLLKAGAWSIFRVLQVLRVINKRNISSKIQSMRPLEAISTGAEMFERRRYMA